MRTEAMIETINNALREKGICKECAFDCKDGKFCMLIAIGSRLKVLQKNVAKAQRLMREAVDDLKDADMLECSHCRHYQKMDVQKCEASDCDCGECKEECACRYCTDNQHWEWRGFYLEEGDVKKLPAVDAEPAQLRIDTVEVDAEKGWYRKLFYCPCGQLIKTETWDPKYCFGHSTVLKGNTMPKHCPNCGMKMDGGDT